MLKKFKMWDERADDQKVARKNTPTKNFEFGDGEIHDIPIYRCLYCNEPMFEIGEDHKGPIASCATPGCEGNHNTPEIYLTAKRRMDERLGVVRDGVWKI